MQHIKKNIGQLLLTFSNCSRHRSIHSLLNDVVAGAVLQPILDLLADPDIINYILEISFNDIPSLKFDEASGVNVEILQDFLVSNKQISRSVSPEISMTKYPRPSII